MAFAGVTVAHAQQQPVQLEPGVARMSYVHGDVSMQRGDSQDWVTPTLNTPLEAGDRVSTGAQSRGELQLDYADILRLDQDATAKIARLDRENIQVQVGAGLVNYSVLKGAQANAEIDTPNMSVHPLHHGSYRIEVLSNSETRLIVREGEAEVSVPQGSTKVEAGNMITVEGTDNPQYQTADAPHRDDFDSFNSDRDRLIANANSWQHTDHYYTGSEDLDAYGSWRDVPDYGPVWVPAEGPAWAPYRDGRWVWEPYYGWTWVSYEPWGWAPYHYGRWMLLDDDWVWWPGPVAVVPAYYPVWAPAYVSFFGFGFGHFGFAFGFGNIGWLPIGPCDGFFPWWGGGFGRGFGRSVNVTNINITNINVTNINNGWRPLYTGHGRQFSNLRNIGENPRLLRAVSGMPADKFGKAAVPRNLVAVNSTTLRNAGAFKGGVPVVPTHDSLRPVDTAPRVPARAAMTGNQKFFTRNPVRTSVKPFDQQAARVAQAIKNSPESKVAPAARADEFGKQSAGAENRASFGKENSAAQAKPSAAIERSFGLGMGGQQRSETQRQSMDASPSANGWHRFGESGEIAQARAEQNPADAQRQSSRGYNTRGSASSEGGASGRRFEGQGSEDHSSPNNGWHSFSRSSGNSTHESGTRSTGSFDRSSTSSGSGMQRDQNWRGFSNNSAYDGNSHESSRRDNAPRDTAPSDNGGWRHFTPQGESGGENRGYSDGRGAYSNESPRGYGSAESRGGYSRPPLDLNQPVVRPRGYGQGRYAQGGYGSYGNREYSNGGYSRPSGGAYSRPSGGGSRSSGASSHPSSGGGPHPH
jgi:hypothetical protein